MRTEGIFVASCGVSACFVALACPVLAAVALLTGSTVSVISACLTAIRWGRPVRILARRGLGRIGRLDKKQPRFVTLRGKIVEAETSIHSPVTGRESVAWRLKISRGLWVDWVGQEGHDLRLSDGTGIAAVDLPSWLVYSGEDTPAPLTRAGARVEHVLRARFGGRAERWLSNPRCRFVETCFVPGNTLVVFGKVTHFGARPRLSPRAIAVDGRSESLVHDLQRRSRRGWITASAWAVLVVALGAILDHTALLPLEPSTWQLAQSEYDQLVAP